MKNVTYIRATPSATPLATQRPLNKLRTNDNNTAVPTPESNLVELATPGGKATGEEAASEEAASEDKNTDSFNTISSPEHVKEFIETINLNNKLLQIRQQAYLTLEAYGEGKGAEYPDGSKGALIKLDETEVFYLANVNGDKHYYLIGSDGQVGQPLTEGANLLVGSPNSPTLTFDIDNEKNLKIRGLRPQHDQPLTTATFNAQTGLLGAHSHPEGSYGWPDMHGFTIVDLWKDPQLAAIKEENTRKLEAVRKQDETIINNYVSIQNAEYIDGSRTALISFGHPEALERTQVFLIENPAGEKRYFEIEVNGELGAPLRENWIITTESSQFNPSLTLQMDESNNLKVSLKEDRSGISTHTVTLDSATNNLSITTYPHGSSSTHQSTTVHEGLWRGATLQYGDSTAGVAHTTAELFDYYSNTNEGQAILSAEGAYFTPTQEVDQRLFIARVLFNRGQGGVELFAEFMPDRDALLDDPNALAAYDTQLNRALTHVKDDSHVSETGLTLDPSLQFLIASAVTEAIGQNPDLVSKVLDDLDRGWIIEYDFGNFGGLYSQKKPLFQSQKAWISLSLSSFLIAFVRPHRLYAVMPHELAHSLDSYRTDGLDGIPTGMDTTDVQILTRERSNLFADFAATSNKNGLRDYAFENTKEFFAEISANYLSSETSARAVWNASPEIFGVLQRYYGLNYSFS